jgi:hypothetical protein
MKDAMVSTFTAEEIALQVRRPAAPQRPPVPANLTTADRLSGFGGGRSS